jgi:hypothetical protein
MPEENSKPSVSSPAVKLEFAKEIKLPTIVLSADTDPTGERIFAACLDGFIYEIPAESDKNRPLVKHDSYASGVRYLRDSRTLISAGYDGKQGLSYVEGVSAETVGATGACDTALWDIAAKAAGMPLYKFLGGGRGEIGA